MLCLSSKTVSELAGCVSTRGSDEQCGIFLVVKKKFLLANKHITKCGIWKVYMDFIHLTLLFIDLIQH
jgi:hypothetical protein